MESSLARYTLDANEMADDDERKDDRSMRNYLIMAILILTNLTPAYAQVFEKYQIVPFQHEQNNNNWRLTAYKINRTTGDISSCLVDLDAGAAPKKFIRTARCAIIGRVTSPNSQIAMLAQRDRDNISAISPHVWAVDISTGIVNICGQIIQAAAGNSCISVPDK